MEHLNTTTMDLFSQPEPVSYFNTCGAKGAELKEYRAKADRQDDKVQDVLRTLGKASPSQVWIALGRAYPITSIRRALTCLTMDDIAVKTDEKVIGEYGRPEHLWALAGTYI